MDIAELGFAINSDPAAQAAVNLDKMTDSANRAASGADKIAQSAVDAADRIKAMVKASTDAAAATGGIAESQRSLAERTSISAQAVADYNAKLLAAANSTEAMRSRVEALNSTQSSSRKFTDEQREALAKLLGQIDPVVKKLGDLDAMEAELRKASAAGILPKEEFATYLAKIETTREALTDVTHGTQGFNLSDLHVGRYE